MTDAEIEAGIKLSLNYGVATACIKPYSIQQAKKILAGSDVKICAVIGFPHGNSATKNKVIDAQAAVPDGAHEVDMVINVGKVLGGDWEYVKTEISAINYVVVHGGAILKVIFENDYLGDEEIIELCKICRQLEVAFVKTSTGYGFVKDTAGSGMYSYKGATVPHLKLMREHCGTKMQIKAAGGVRSLEDLLKVRALGVTRVGATATVPMLEEAKKRGIGGEEVEVDIKWTERTSGSSSSC